MNEGVFIRTVRKHFKKAGRHDLPWRNTADPYKIVVSEIMLQQTQVPRVIQKYASFLKAFPTVTKLAEASLGDVLKEWSGLGYNRRAKFLYQMAQVVTGEHKVKFPTTIEGLRNLPGIGLYTAGAVYAFAYNKPHAIIETNIRTVYIHHFFKDQEHVSDKELITIIEKTLDTKNPREWYWALMDYGSYLKASGIKNNSKSKHYAKQSKFVGSKRSVRGHILRVLTKNPATLLQLKKDAPKTEYTIEEVLKDLIQEGFIIKNKNKYFLQ